MIVCQKGEEPPHEDEPEKPRKKDPNKVDKKFLWPHGITPPLKNVRKRRFRKTLRKKVRRPFSYPLIFPAGYRLVSWTTDVKMVVFRCLLVV
jgi:hypothetical protein